MAEVVPLKAPLGARIEGLERGRANEPAVAALLNRALAEHLLVVIPGEPMTPEEIAETPDVEHPLVRTHPETGRKALYLNPNRQDRIAGLARTESDALLDELGAEARKPQHHFGHVWHAGDVVVWDNRATMHRVMLDYPVGENRVMQRVLIEGDKPV